MNVTLRPARASDLAAAAALIDDQPLFEPYGLTAAGLERSLAAALERAEEVHVAAAGTEVLGLVWFQLRGAFGRSGYLRLLVTDAASQGSGLGGRLLQLAEQLVFAQAEDMFLMVNSSNEGAQRFYLRHGYHTVGTIGDYVAPGLDELLLRKSREPVP